MSKVEWQAIAWAGGLLLTAYAVWVFFVYLGLVSLDLLGVLPSSCS